MPAILRKSLTACEGLAALPPTPRMKRRPPAARVAARSCAAFSMLAVSSFEMISADSARKERAKLLGSGAFIGARLRLELLVGSGNFPSLSIRRANRFRRSAHELQKRPTR